MDQMLNLQRQSVDGQERQHMQCCLGKKSANLKENVSDKYN